jgi:hypothetical protein
MKRLPTIDTHHQCFSTRDTSIQATSEQLAPFAVLFHAKLHRRSRNGTSRPRVFPSREPQSPRKPSVSVALHQTLFFVLGDYTLPICTHTFSPFPYITNHIMSNAVMSLFQYHWPEKGLLVTRVFEYLNIYYYGWKINTWVYMQHRHIQMSIRPSTPKMLEHIASIAQASGHP